MEWLVYRYNINSNKIETYNIFDHASFNAEVKCLLKESKGKDKFAQSLNSQLMYYFWSRAQWEVCLVPWVGSNDSIEVKIDVYQQVTNNWKQFVDYVWNYNRIG